MTGPLLKYSLVPNYIFIRTVAVILPNNISEKNSQKRLKKKKIQCTSTLVQKSRLHHEKIDGKTNYTCRLVYIIFNEIKMTYTIEKLLQKV